MQSTVPLLQVGNSKNFEDENYYIQIEDYPKTSFSHHDKIFNYSSANKKDDISDSKRATQRPLLVGSSSQSDADEAEQPFNSPYRTNVGNISTEGCTCACKNVPLGRDSQNGKCSAIRQRLSSVADRVTCMIDCEKCGSDFRRFSSAFPSDSANQNDQYHEQPSVSR